MTREEEMQEAATEARCAVATSVSGDNYTSIDDLPFIEGKLSYNELVENAFIRGAEWADGHPAKSEDNVILSFHVCNIPWAEEVMAGANAKYDAYFVSVPKNLIPKKLLEVITTDSHYKYISQVALLKDGLV